MKASYCIIDAVTGRPVRWHRSRRYLADWCYWQNLCLGRERYRVEVRS